MSILSDEITNDPTGKGYAALLPDQPGHVVVILNALTEQILGLLTRTNLAKWAAKTGMRLVIQQEADNQASLLCSLAMTIIDVLRGASGGIDFSDADNVASLGAWVASGKLSTANRDLMLSMAMQPASRMDVLGLPTATEEMLRNR